MKTNFLRPVPCTSDAGIYRLKGKFAKVQMYQELLAANKTMEDLGLSDGKMAELLNTGTIMTELKRKVDEFDVTLMIGDQTGGGDDLKTDLTRGSSSSITDDDLL